VLGISTIGGSQHLRAKGMLTAGGLDAEKDVTSFQINDQTMQLQALINNSVQITALSPPWVAVARDKFKMNILDSALERFAGIDSGLVVPVKLLQEKPNLVKKILRARAKGNRFYLENERDGSEFLARLYKVDVKIALESYRASKPAFTSTGIPSISLVTHRRSNCPSRCHLRRSLISVSREMCCASSELKGEPRIVLCLMMDRTLLSEKRHQVHFATKAVSWRFSRLQPSPETSPRPQ
jgi:hypothetical protein